jgi:hypothetical protein
MDDTQQLTVSNILNDYMSMYPEDALKWIVFLTEAKRNTQQTNIHIRRTNSGNIDALIQEMNVPTRIDDIQIDPVNGCTYCKKTWSDTESVPKIELMCGHKYHSMCYFIMSAEYDSYMCNINECGMNMDSIAHRIKNNREIENSKVIDPLHTIIMERDDFKNDLKHLKEEISKVSRSYSAYSKKVDLERKALIRKHVHSINYLQTDMNDTVNKISKSNEALALKSQISAYRRKASSMYRKYRISFRDLHRSNKIKVRWNIRYALERHRQLTGRYRFGIRISPGKRIWQVREDN